MHRFRAIFTNFARHSYLLLRDNRCKTSHPHDLSMLNTVHITSHKLLSNRVETIQTAGREIVS